jgi:SAM-dependent methyltransferase
MGTMPFRSRPGQPDAAQAWFASSEGVTLLDSEQATIESALAERPAQPWLWLAPLPPRRPDSRGLALYARGERFDGEVACAVPLPLPSACFATVVLQHVATPDARGSAMLEEVQRVLVPGGRVLLFGLNPLSPYRWRWRGHGLSAAEPLSWRRLLRRAGLEPDAVSEGMGPRWDLEADTRPQRGTGLRAAYLVRADKRSLPLTPVRRRRLLPIAPGAAPA